MIYKQSTAPRRHLTIIVMLVLIGILVTQQVLAVCTYTVIGQGYTTTVNTCGQGGQSLFGVWVSDVIRWDDQLTNTAVKASYDHFACVTDSAVITRTSGLFVDDTSEPWIDYSFYRIQLARRTTTVPNTLFVVDEQTSYSCMRSHPSPIAISRDHTALDLSSPESGIDFDLAMSGTPQRIAWTKAKADVWLLISGTNVTNGAQLWGNLTKPQAPPIEEDETENGFRALRAVDSNGDMKINAADAIWPQLHLWRDGNHDGISQPEEVKTMAEVGVSSIRLDYHDKIGKRDQYGSLYSQTVKVDMADGSTRWATDFYPAVSSKPDSIAEQVISPR
jgi:hypothetical protein